MKALSIFTTSVVLVGALLTVVSCTPTSEQTLAKIPLYGSCERLLSRYGEKLNKLGYDVNFIKEEFSARTAAHPGLLGILRIVGSLNDQELADVQNGLRVICLPTDFVQLEATPIGIQEILRIIREDPDEESYLTYDGKNLVLYVNNSTQEQRSTVLN